MQDALQGSRDFGIRQLIAHQLRADIALERIDEENGEVICDKRSYRSAYLAALEDESRWDGNQQLHSERNQAAAEHPDRPSAGDVFRRGLFPNNLQVKPNALLS